MTIGMTLYLCFVAYLLSAIIGTVVHKDKTIPVWKRFTASALLPITITAGLIMRIIRALF